MYVSLQNLVFWLNILFSFAFFIKNFYFDVLISIQIISSLELQIPLGSQSTFIFSCAESTVLITRSVYYE